jgi:hypothetical protein
MIQLFHRTANRSICLLDESAVDEIESFLLPELQRKPGIDVICKDERSRGICDP